MKKGEVVFPLAETATVSVTKVPLLADTSLHICLKPHRATILSGF